MGINDEFYYGYAICLYPSRMTGHQREELWNLIEIISENDNVPYDKDKQYPRIHYDGYLDDTFILFGINNIMNGDFDRMPIAWTSRFDKEQQQIPTENKGSWSDLLNKSSYYGNNTEEKRSVPTFAYMIQGESWNDTMRKQPVDSYVNTLMETNLQYSLNVDAHVFDKLRSYLVCRVHGWLIGMLKLI